MRTSLTSACLHGCETGLTCFVRAQIISQQYPFEPLQYSSGKNPRLMYPEAIAMLRFVGRATAFDRASFWMLDQVSQQFRLVSLMPMRDHCRRVVGLRVLMLPGCWDTRPDGVGMVGCEG
eukprot:3672750-Rhodomonas_salina.2